ncbi:MAG: hypothetical protein DPW09_33335 [Anaerolineae bacterium]|nr:hypothetical protein [Anaerolineales bacterium]MCQ3978336.1 hypothetical protein [Anaerolineae bacterium]
MPHTTLRSPRRGTTTPPAVITKVGREQHGYPLKKARCAWCGQPGATDPHHWLLKRSAAVHPKILHDPRNIALVHHACHDLYGQTEAMVQRCYHHKIKKLFYSPGRPTLSGRPYDIAGWIAVLRARQLLRHAPVLPVLDEKEEKLYAPEDQTIEGSEKRPELSPA